jgi:hypothetical protein
MKDPRNRTGRRDATGNHRQAISHRSPPSGPRSALRAGERPARS